MVVTAACCKALVPVVCPQACFQLTISAYPDGSKPSKTRAPQPEEEWARTAALDAGPADTGVRSTRAEGCQSTDRARIAAGGGPKACVRRQLEHRKRYPAEARILQEVGGGSDRRARGSRVGSSIQRDHRFAWPSNRHGSRRWRSAYF